MMKFILCRVFHCSINDDPPAGEKLQKQHPRLCKYVKSSIQIYICFYCFEEISGNTRTPAAIEAIVFLRSPQSTLHSQSPHRIPSRNPDMTLEKSKCRCKSGFELRERQLSLNSLKKTNNISFY